MGRTNKNKQDVKRGKFCPFDKSGLYKTRRRFRYPAVEVYDESVFQCGVCNRLFICTDKLPFGVIPKPNNKLEDIYNLSKRFDNNNLEQLIKHSQKRTDTKHNINKKPIQKMSAPGGGKVFTYVTATQATKCLANGCEGNLIKLAYEPEGFTVKMCFTCKMIYCKYSIYSHHTDIFDASPEQVREIENTIIVSQKLERESEKQVYSSNDNPKAESEKAKAETIKVKPKAILSKESNNEFKDNGIYINPKDFVVKGNTFKCRCKQHHLEDIAAKVAIWLPENGDEKVETISAGYCRECRVFFIMQSTFKKLKTKGMIACRISDEKNYYKAKANNNMSLADESILMQFGYSVSEQDGLSARARHKILANLLDHRVMTKSEIISYLDFFINFNHSRERAISKWEEDKEFIEQYHLGDYRVYGIKGIYSL